MTTHKPKNRIDRYWAGGIGYVHCTCTCAIPGRIWGRVSPHKRVAKGMEKGKVGKWEGERGGGGLLKS